MPTTDVAQSSLWPTRKAFQAFTCRLYIFCCNLQRDKSFENFPTVYDSHQLNHYNCHKQTCNTSSFQNSCTAIQFQCPRSMCLCTRRIDHVQNPLMSSPCTAAKCIPYFGPINSGDAPSCLNCPAKVHLEPKDASYDMQSHALTHWCPLRWKGT